MPLKASTWEPPRPWRPATPTRMTELAPITRPDDLVPATVTVAAAARVVFRKSRRFWSVIGRPFVGVGPERQKRILALILGGRGARKGVPARGRDFSGGACEGRRPVVPWPWGQRP